ncbi:acyltransferase family protein [Mucilaginibacter lappiensis]|uniref:Acyltransferase 3 domain-containing protein n=1 Tax=Mucilaginibacter lappiensis TaxID=354630 RepID=A0A841JHW5_9SPHI|nr:acyltransferase [Mucilaginibacter lappiensis]MBB6130759.1 hypothetical protein [Mucilaginibacter lappiensis]
MNNLSLEYKQSQMINVLRFPLIVLVLFTHELPFKREPVHLKFTGTDVYVLLSELISHHSVAVPCFFLFSGYLFFFKINNWNYKVYTTQLRKRVNTLIIPYIIWNLLLLLAIFLKNLFFQKAGFQTDCEYKTLKENSAYALLWGMPINFSLWYIRDLIVMTLLTPLFYYYFKYLNFYGIILLLLIYLSGLESNIPGLSTTAIFYFSLGGYLGLCKHNLLKISLAYGKIAILITLALLAIRIYYDGTSAQEYWERVYIFFTVISILYGGARLIEWPRLKDKLLQLSGTVFFVYASHQIYIINGLKGALFKSPLANSGWGMLLGYFIIPPACIAIILLIYYPMKRFLPKTLGVLVGNRTV